MVTSKIQNSAAAAAEFWISEFGIKEVWVVKSLDFANWPFPESAAAELKRIQIMISRAGHYYYRLCQI